MSLDGLARVLRSRADKTRRGELDVKGTKAAVLLGAGSSVSAGIPLADDIVQEVCRKFPELVRNSQPGYAAHMACLASADITNLLRKYIDDAAVNAAHLFLAQIVKAGYIDRILTTNFDSLAVQALLLVNERPFIYDLANMKVFKPGQVAAPSVFHLHGQFGGFVNLNTPGEFQKLGLLVQDVLRDTLAERALIIVGYGGTNDPVFDQLCQYGTQYGEYHNGVYWVSYNNAEPPEHVKSNLLVDTTKRAYYLRDYDADTFFMDLARALNCGLPQIIERPFTFLSDTVRKIGTLTSAGRTDDLIAATRQIIKFAIECHEMDQICARGTRQRVDRERAKILKEAQDIREGRRIDEVESVLEKAQKFEVQPAIDLLAQTWAEHGDRLLKEAREDESPQGIVKASEAVSYLKRAIGLRPESLEFQCACADALVVSALRARDPESNRFFSEAIDHYRLATTVASLGHELYFPHDGSTDVIDLDPAIPGIVPVAYAKWGDALVEFSTHTRRDQAQQLLQDATAKYQYAIAMNPQLDYLQQRIEGLRKLAKDQVNNA